MRLSRWLIVACGAGVLLGPATAVAQSARSVLIGASIGPATSLHVSSSVLRFDPEEPGGLVGRIDIDARARARSSGEVVLTVEALRDLAGLAGGPGAAPVVIEFAGAGEGFVPGVLAEVPQVAGRWVGSGIRRGQIQFTLRSGDAPGGSVVPLRFVLTAP